MSANKTSPFNWRGPSILDLGRIKSESQLKKDAKRVNRESNVGMATQQTNSFKAPR